MKSNNPTYIPNELASAVPGGAVASSEQIRDYNLGLSQETINSIVLGNAINVALSANKSAIFVQQEGSTPNTVTLTATMNNAADTVIIYRDGEEIGRGSGSSIIQTNGTTKFVFTDSITPTAYRIYEYTAKFIIGDYSKTTSVSKVTATYPIFYGAGANSDTAPDSLTRDTTARASASATYNIGTTDGQHLYFEVPYGMSITSLQLVSTYPTSLGITSVVTSRVDAEGRAYNAYKNVEPRGAGTYNYKIS